MHTHICTCALTHNAQRYACAHTRRAYSVIVAWEKCVSLCPWISFVIRTPGSQPVGKMRATSSALPDLGHRWLSPEALHTSHSWTVNEPGPGFHCRDQPAPLSSSRRLAHRKHRCAHTRSWRLLHLARPDLHRLGPQLSYLTLRKYRPRNSLFMIPL